MSRLLALLAASLVLSSCTTADGPPAAPPTRHAAIPTVGPEPHKLTPRQVVTDPDATLNGWHVESRDGRLVVTTAWVSCPRQHCHQAIAVSDDGFRSVDYLPATRHNQVKYLFSAARLPTRREQRLFPHRLVTSVASLGTRRGLVAGGDGATLYPFERAARSDDGGATWTAFRVPHVHGEQPYDGGDAVLPDGRLLVLLDAWSGDRHQQPSDRFHGLWVSGRDDWSSFHPFRPAFRPRLQHDPDGGATLNGLSATPESGLLTATTWNSRLYVSRDGGRTFREIAAR